MSRARMGLAATVIGCVTGGFVFATVVVARAGEVEQPPGVPPGVVGSILSTVPDNSPPQGPTRATPPRDPRSQPPPPQPTGTGVIRGRVVDAVTGQAIPRVNVSISGPTSGSGKTDDGGAFAFTGLAPGPYTVMANKNGYLPATSPEGPRTIRGRRPLMVQNGQSLDNVAVPIFRGGAITGRIVDEFGDPVDRAQVQLLQVPQRSSQQRWQMFGGEMTNELGEFRVGRLPPGKYLVAVRSTFQEFARRSPSNPEGGPAAGPGPVMTFYPGVASIDEATPLTIERGQTQSGIDIPIVAVEKTLVNGSVVSGTGGVPGHPNIRVQQVLRDGRRASWDSQPTHMGPDGTFKLALAPGVYDFTATTYPQMADGGRSPGGRAGAGPPVPTKPQYAAARVTVGGEATDVSLVTSPGATVTGRVIVEVDGTPPQMTGTTVGLFTGVSGRDDECRRGEQAELKADGTFTQEGVWGVCRAATMGNFGRLRVKAIRHRGTDITDRTVDLTKVDAMRGVEIVLTDRESALSFEVTGDSGAPTMDYVALAFPVDKTRWDGMTSVRVYAPSPPGQTGIAAPGGMAGSSIGPVGPGASRGMAAGGEAVALAGAGVAQPIAGHMGVVAGVTMDAGSMSSFTLSQNQGLGMFSFGSRNGINGLRAGEYYVIALDDVGLETMRDPVYLESLAAIASRVTVADGETRTIQLQRHTAP